MSAREIDEAGLVAALADLPRGRRSIVALAGAPGSGKSTLAERLRDRLQEEGPDRARILPMDGYHYDDGLLDRLGRRARKGAPDTFDVGGLASMLDRLRRNEEAAIAVPRFDREIEIARAGADLIPRETEIVLVEGNYLLIDVPPWETLRPYFDLAVLIDVPEETLRARLEARWRGFGLSADAIRDKVEGNDLPNGRLVRDRSATPDLRLRQ